jgi:hypothetical protein
MKCGPCFHPLREQIDRQIVDGVPYRTIATRFHLSLGTINRHRAHLKEMLNDALQERAGERSERGSDLLNRVTKLVDEAESLLAVAKSKENIVGATSAINSACRLLELCGKLSGELSSQNIGGIHLTVNKTTTVNNYDDDAAFAEMIGEATRGFDVAELMRLKSIAQRTLPDRGSDHHQVIDL